MKKLVVCGFTGSGKSFALERIKKSAAGKHLWEFIDLDHYLCSILEIVPASLGSWIDHNGFDLFRQLESKYLEDLLNRDNIVIAVGGGAIHPASKQILREAGAEVFWIDEDFEACWERIMSDFNRPIVKLGKERAFNLYQSRKLELVEFRAYADIEKLISDIGNLIEVVE